MSNWTLTNAWRQSYEKFQSRPPQVRDYLWASELGSAPIDMYHKLKGTPITNPPNFRSFRKFDSGYVFEDLIKEVLDMTGILTFPQTRVEYQYPGLLKVTGRLDITAGGKMDFDKARSVIDAKKYSSESRKLQQKYVVECLEADYKNVDLENIILEVKSCSSFMMDKYEVTNKASPEHTLQAYHYLKGTGMKEAHIIYICRNDCRMVEIPIFLGQEDVETKYMGYISLISEMVKSDQIPPLEPLMVLNESGKVGSNWKIEYSPYLTMLYGFATPMDYRLKVDPLVGRFNRVVSRINEKKEMTADNLKAIDEMKGYGINVGLQLDKTL